jgi:hypothetical protein
MSRVVASRRWLQKRQCWVWIWWRWVVDSAILGLLCLLIGECLFVTAYDCCLVEVRRVGVGAVVLVSGLVFRGTCLDGMTFAKGGDYYLRDISRKSKFIFSAKERCEIRITSRKRAELQNCRGGGLIGYRLDLYSYGVVNCCF